MNHSLSRTVVCLILIRIIELSVKQLTSGCFCIIQLMKFYQPKHPEIS